MNNFKAFSGQSLAAATGLLLALALVAAWTLPGKAQEGGLRLVEQDRLRILTEVARHIEADYLDPEKGTEIAAALQTRKTLRGLARDLPRPFADNVTSQLYALGGDRHLSLKWAPGSGKISPATLAQSANYGVRAVRILDGNIGLLRLDGFYSGLSAKETLSAALIVLGSTEALILDLRKNSGGASDAVRFLQSCFFAEPTLVMHYEDEPGNRSDSYTEVWPGSSGCSDKPLYVLIGPETASAAEDFAYSAKAFGHGTLVGETSAGAANFVRHYSIEPGFRLAVSVGRPVHPVTGDNWESVGVTPDIAVPLDVAEARAHFEALRAVSSDKARPQYSYPLLKASAQAFPATLSLVDLGPFAGRYEGIRLDLQSDGLVINGAGFSGSLRPLTGRAFAMEKDGQPFVLMNRVDDLVVSLSLLYPGGRTETFERTSN